MIRAVELVRVRLPYRRRVVTSYGVETHRDAVLVRVETDQGDGWGEDVALPTPGYVPEYADASVEVLRRYLVPRLLGAGEVEPATVARVLDEVRGWRLATAALVDAVLDVHLRSRGLSLARALGATRDRVEVGTVIGIGTDVEATVSAALEAVAAGYRRLKMKIAPGHDIEPVAAVRAAVGDHIVIQVDANGAYTLDDLDHLRRLEAAGVAAVEQPLAATDLVGHRELGRHLTIPIALDEPITSVDMALAALDLGACRVMCVKPGRLGGILEAARLVRICRDRGVDVWIGGMYETGIGRRVNLAVAALDGVTLPGDLSPPSNHLDRDVLTALEMVHGEIAVPAGPGFGPTPDPDHLSALGAVVERLEA